MRGNKIEHAKIQALRNWAKSLRTVMTQREKIMEKIHKLENDLKPFDDQISAYNSLISATFDKEIFNGLQISDLVQFVKVEGASICKLNPQWIEEETTEKTDKNGKIVKSTTYYYHIPERDDQNVSESKSEVDNTKSEQVIENTVIEEVVSNPEKPDTAEEQPVVKGSNIFDNEALLDTL